MKSMNSTDATKWLTTPRRMRCIVPGHLHNIEHDWSPTCDLSPKCLPVDPAPVTEPHLTEEERNVVSWSKAQVQTIIFRLCRELDDKDNSINECMKDIAEQRRRAERIDRNATAVVNQLKYNLAAAQEREKGLREALEKSPCCCRTVGIAGRPPIICVRCAALTKEDKP